MANTVKTTNRTIEVSAIDEDYMMPINLNVQSVVFIPGIAFKFPGTGCVDIVESSIYATDPVKVKLMSTDDEPRYWIFNQRLQLGFVFANGVFETGSKVIFNIGEIKSGNSAVSAQIKLNFGASETLALRITRDGSTRITRDGSERIERDGVDL